MAWSLGLKEQGRAGCLWRGGKHRWNWFLVSIFHVENWLVHPVVWSMGAVVLRKNLSKCVISPLMEHRRKPILLILQRLSLSLSFLFSVPIKTAQVLQDHISLSLTLSLLLLSSFSCFLMSPFHYGPSIYQLFSGKEGLSPMCAFLLRWLWLWVSGPVVEGRRSYLWRWHRRHSLMELCNILYRNPVCLRLEKWLQADGLPHMHTEWQE